MPLHPDQSDAQARAEAIRRQTLLDLMAENVAERVAAEFARRAAAAFFGGATFAAERAHQGAAQSVAIYAAEGRAVDGEMPSRHVRADEAAA